MKSKNKLVFLSVILAVLLTFMTAMVVTAMVCPAAMTISANIWTLCGGISLIAVTAAWTDAFFEYRRETSFAKEDEPTDDNEQ